MKKRWLLLLLSGLSSSCSEPASTAAATETSTPQQQELLQQGSSRAASCMACHGQQGISTVPLYPSLAGKEQHKLKKALLDYRSGKKVNPLMSPQAKPLTDADIELLSAYFSALPGKKK